MNINEIIKYKREFPFLCGELKRNKIWLYDATGASRELKSKHKKTIRRLKSQYKIEVFSVLESFMKADSQRIKMTSYLYVSDEVGFQKYKGKMYCVPAYVDNETWDIKEFGDIVIVERSGMLQRVY
jgi:hypothetical protein